MLAGENESIITIWEYEVPNPKPADNELLVLWRGTDETGLNNIISMQELVEAEAEFLRRKYLEWIDDLSRVKFNGENLVQRLALRDNFSAWWLTLIDQKSNYCHSPQVSDIVKLLALINFVLKNKKISKMCVFSSHEYLIKTLNEWCTENSVNFVVSEIRQAQTTRAKNERVYSILRGVLWTSLQFIKRSRLRKVDLDRWCSDYRSIIFFTFLPTDLTKSIYPDKFWGPLMGQLSSNKIKIKVVFVYSGPFMREDCRKINNFIGRIESDLTGTICTSLSSFFSLDVCIRTIKDWFKIRNRAKNTLWDSLDLRLAGFNVKSFFKGDWDESFRGGASLQSILNLNLLEESLKGLGKGTVGFYLFEGQSWELALVSTWKRFGLKSISGYAHSTVRFWDLRYFHSDRSHFTHGPLSRPMCDRIILNGNLALKNFFVTKCNSTRIFNCEALRYLYLSNPTKYDQCEGKVRLDARFPISSGPCTSVAEDIVSSVQGSIQFRKIVIILDYTFHHSARLLKMLRYSRVREIGEIVFNIRMHPEASFDIELPPGLTVTPKNIPLQYELYSHDLVICSSVSSASLESYILGKPLLIYCDPSELNMTSVRGLPGVSYFSTSMGLDRHLTNQSFLHSLRVPCSELFNLDPRLPSWRRLLVDDEMFFKSR